MTLKAVGLLSPGDMGHVVGRVLSNHGMRVLTCLEGRSERTRGLAQKAGIASVPSYGKLVRGTDLILSILVPGEAKNVADRVVQALREEKEEIVYVDCNAVSPATVRAIGKIFEETGSRFVDAGIIGPPPRDQGTTRFYASGRDAREFETLKAYGLDVRVVGKSVGQASGLKMSYAALTKGTAALSTELLVASWRMGLYEALVEEFKLSQPERYRVMERGLPIMPCKSRRWIGEMEEIGKTFEDLGLTPKIYQGAADIYRFVGETAVANETPETLDRTRTLEGLIEILAEKLK